MMLIKSALYKTILWVVLIELLLTHFLPCPRYQFNAQLPFGILIMSAFCCRLPPACTYTKGGKEEKERKGEQCLLCKLRIYLVSLLEISCLMVYKTHWIALHTKWTLELGRRYQCFNHFVLVWKVSDSKQHPKLSFGAFHHSFLLYWYDTVSSVLFKLLADIDQ